MMESDGSGGGATVNMSSADVVGFPE